MSGGRSGGQSLVEVALVLPVFILAIVGLFDVGRLVFAYNTVSNAARQAVRVAIVDQQQARVEAKATDALISLDLPAVTVTYAPCPTSPARIGCPVSITVAYAWRAITPLIGDLVGDVTVGATTTMPIERVFSSP